MRRKIWFPLVFIVLVAIGGLTATLISGNSPELGLDLQGGVSVVLEPTQEASSDALGQAVDIIRDRVDALGVAEPEITRQGNAIVVQLPGVKNRDRALELVGQTAELRFRPVLQDLTGSEVIQPDESGSTTTTTAEGAAGTTTTTAGGSTTTTTAPDENAAGLPLGESAGAAQEPTTTTAPPTTTTTAPGAPAESEPVPLTSRQDDKADATVTLQGKDGEGVFQLGPTLATGQIVSSARAEIPQGQWLVALSMKGGADGIDKFNEIAAQCNPPSAVCPTGRLAIVLDSVVQSAPTINEPSYSKDDITISGSFSESEAKDLALVLRYGSLPVELERQSVQTVSASLGEDSLRAGIIAGIVGLLLVALYMLLYYRSLGLVMIVGVGISGALLYAIVSWMGETRGLALTLAGVTGIIVSIGVTVDSYVVFFERLKDEVKAGRTLRTSTERAFKRAFRTILAADISSFLGAAILWWLTVGSVRGFAFFLGLSTVLDVIVAWFFTRPAVMLLSRNRFFTEMPGFGVARGLASRGGLARPAAAPVPGAGK
ncbi:MAG TPA: protein translocase subunit SecD [Acidimicrobiales bacterium]|nr:protein translocase subunit SecD [Acidimicrobiales bacterium]